MVLPATARSKEFTMTDYTPKSLADIIIGDEFSNDAVRYIADGSLPFPNAGKNGFLFYGPYGTGKTTLAKLLPSEIEKLYGKPADPFVWFQESDDETKVNTRIVKNLTTAAQLNNCTGSKFKHFIIDEVDGFSKAHQKKIRTAMNFNNDNIFYFTTNEKYRLDDGLRNRCYEIHMRAASADQWLPLFNRVLMDRGVAIPNAAHALSVIESCNGSIRDIIAAANMMAAKIIKQQAIAANSDDPEQEAA